MPGGDGTGPMGRGPMTGGRRGFCGTAFSGQSRKAGGFGGFGRGRRRGLGCRFEGISEQNSEDERVSLKEQERVLSAELEKIRTRLNVTKQS